MNDEISDLRLFCKIVDAGNLSEAARQCDSSPATMSRRLSAMEKRLSVRLFRRSSRRFSLTDEGILYYERAQNILAQLDAAEAEITAKTVKPSGLLRISAPMQIGRTLITPIIAKFSALYPDIDIRFTLSDDQPDVNDANIDVSIRIGLPDAPDIVVRQLITSRRAVCATPEYLAKNGTPQTPEDLLTHHCICLMRKNRKFDRWVFQENGKKHHIQVKGQLATSSGEVLHALIRAGRGIGLKAMWDIADDIQTGALVECLGDYACDDIALYATFEKHPFLPPRIRHFLDVLSSELQHTSAM
jgi:DNA-binding transcriptional LysR family regulator